MGIFDLLAIALGLIGFFAAGVGVRRRVGVADPALARLTEITIGLSALLVTSEIIGLFGLFRPLSLAIVGVALGWLLLRGTKRGAWSGSLNLRSPSALIAGSAVGLLVIAWSGEIARSLHGGMYRQDSLWYHLPLAAGFFQDGQVGGLQITDPMALTAWFYPQNSEIFHAVGMLALGDDFLSVFLNLAWAGVALLAAWCIGRPFGKGPWTALSMTCILVMPTMVLQSGNAPNDIVGLAFMAASIAFAVNSGAGLTRGHAGAVKQHLLVFSGLAAGLAIGSKMTLIVPLAVILLAVVVLSKPAERMRSGLIWVGGCVATGGFWFFRNLIISGTPVPWLNLGPFTGPDQPDLYPRPPHAVADYIFRPDLWVNAFGPGLTDAIGYAWPLVAVVVIVGLVVALVDRSRPVVMFLGAAGLLTGLAYAFIPISASGNLGSPTGFGSNLRYASPALFLGFTGLVLSQDRLRLFREHRRIVPGILLLTAVTGTFMALEPSWRATFVTATLILAITIVGLTLKQPSRLRRLAVGGALTFFIVAVAVPARSSYLADRYRADLIPPPTNPGFRSTDNWRPIQDWARHQENRKVGIVGPSSVFGQYVFYGSDLSNRVSFAGVPLDHGGMRPAGSCEEWRELVNEKGFDLIVSTPSTGPFGTSDSQEAWWTRQDPGAREILRSTPASVFAIEGELNPSLCYARNRVTMNKDGWGGTSPVPQDTIPPPEKQAAESP